MTIKFEATSRAVRWTCREREALNSGAVTCGESMVDPSTFPDLEDFCRPPSRAHRWQDD